MKFSVLGCYSPYAPFKGACSGYLLQNQKTNIMIDCGNGTFSNLQKFIDFRELSALIITHFHLDHWSDLESIRLAFKQALSDGSREEPLVVYAPKESEEFEILSQWEDIFITIPIEDSLDRNNCFGKLYLRFFKVDHSIPNYGVKFKYGDKKISYTSDTRYFDGIIEEVKDSDILFSEATFMEKDSDKAKMGHLTAKQAGRIAELSSAKKLVLTHLFPEYNHNILKREAEITFEGKVELAKMLKTYEL